MTRPRAHRSAAGSGERGITVVFFAISLTAMLAVAGLVLGGSVGYTAVRNAQTAADAAALAGAGTLRDHKQDWVTTPASAVLTEVRSVVEDNGAHLVPGGCQLVSAEYALNPTEDNVIDDCEELEVLDDALFKSVAGVRVTVSDTRDVPFAAFVDRSTITGGATAAATAQPLAEGRAPFMVCASPDATGHPAVALLPDDSDPTGYRVNAAAVGKPYVLWGNQMKERGRDCGNPASDWRGLVQFGSTFPIPSDPADQSSWWRTESGNSGGNLPGTVAGTNACELDGTGVGTLASQIGCRITVPLCPKGNGMTDDFRLDCVKLGAFEISHVGTVTSTLEPLNEDGSPCGEVTNNIICGEFLGAATAVGGKGVARSPEANEVVTIKLVE